MTRPTQKKGGGTGTGPPTRTVFVKDEGRSRDGFVSFEEANAARDLMGPDDERQRTRVSFRSRTGRWDLLVKVAREVPAAEERKETGG